MSHARYFVKCITQLTGAASGTDAVAVKQKNGAQIPNFHLVSHQHVAYNLGQYFGNQSKQEVLTKEST